VTHHRRAARRRLAEDAGADDGLQAIVDEVTKALDPDEEFLKDIVDRLPNGAFVPTNCMTKEIKAALTTGLQVVKDKFGYEITLKGLHACETQPTETTNVYLEVTVKDDKGKEYAFEINLRQSFSDLCPEAPVNGTDMKSLTNCIESYFDMPADEDEARRMLSQFDVEDFNQVDGFSNKPRVSDDTYAPPSTPVDESTDDAGRTALRGVTLLAAVVGIVAFVML